MLRAGVQGGGGVALDAGGAIFSQSIVDSVIVDNHSAGNGGGVYAWEVTLLASSTVAGNSAAGTAGGIYIRSGLHSTLENSILWDNTAGEPTGVQLTSNGQFSNLDIRSCVLEGGEAALAYGASAATTFANNFDSDPLFVGTGSVPWTLGAGSPCIDAGDWTLLPPDTVDFDADGNTTEDIPFDIVGNARRKNDPAAPDVGAGPRPVLDIGAYEREPR
jgi:hypothetical protein